MSDGPERIRTSWFGMGGRPRLPYYLRADKGRRLKSLDEFEEPPSKGRMARVELRRTLAWYAMMAGAVAAGVGLGLVLF